MSKIVLFILFLTVMSSRIFAVEYNSDELNNLTTELRAGIPEGWKVSINRFHKSDNNDIHIEIWRTEEVQFLIPEVSNAPEPLAESYPPNPPRLFYFNFLLVDYLSPEDYARFRKENAIIEARLAEFTKEMSDLKRHGKSRAFGDTRPLGYYPETEDEKRRLQKFIDYEKSHPKHDLRPNFYYQKMSFYFFDPRNLARLKSDEIDKECTAVLKSISKIFRSYEEVSTLK